jgi:hypothetical protein
MNKSKTILASVGGVALVASLALAYLIWSAFSDKSEREGDLDGAIATADRLSRLPVYPGEEGIKAYKENADTYAAWREEAVKTAAAGDMTFEATTPPAFKSFLVDDARRLSALPGAVDGRIVKEEFPFGFKDYITGGVLPVQADLARLQREWHDVSTVVEALAKCGVAEVVDVALVAPAPVKEEPVKKGKKHKKQAKSDEASGPAVTKFTVEFRTRPAGLVNAVNEFITSPRFIVVDDFSFVREKDDIAEALSGEGKQQQEASGRGRRGRRGRQAEEEPQPEAAKAPGVVTDPASASLLKVTMSFSVYDFRSLEGADGTAAEKPEEGK